MTDLRTISNQPLEHPGMDFALLRDEGVKYIESLASRVWTDYNTHDPGITILEHLCYAITDLSYRLDFDIEDLLASPAGASEASSKQFFLAHEILTINPLTVGDYRKLLIDVEGVKNAWLYKAGEPYPGVSCDCFEPDLGDEYQVHTLNGLYAIQVESETRQSERSPEDDEALKIRVRKRLLGARNLCEDFSEIDIIDEEIIGVKADIELKKDAMHKPSDCGDVTSEAGSGDENELLAEIYFRLKNHISPSIYHYSLNQMLQKGIPIEQAFNGPRLTSGFVDDEEIAMSVKKTHLYTSDLVHIILDIENVETITSMTLKKEPPADADQDDEKWQPRKWQIELEHDRVPYLKDIDAFLEDCEGRIALAKRRLTCEDESSECENQYRDTYDNGIVFFEGDVPYTIDRDRVKDHLFKLEAEARGVPLSLLEQILAAPTGEYRELCDFETLQNDFPINYGIGNIGLPSNATAERRAKAQQLRAYLMFFDQLLANYFVQLDHARELLSVNNASTRTYFTQALQADTGIEELLDLRGEFEDIEGLLKSADLLEDTELSQCRRDKFFDHLLSRFCDSFTDYSMSLYKLSLERQCSDPVLGFDPDAHEWYLSQKGDFLRQYSTLSAARGQAFDYGDSSGVWDTDNVSGLKKRIGKLIHIPNFSRHSIVPVRCGNEEFCDGYLFEEGFHVLEHILLRPGEQPQGVEDWHLAVIREASEADTSQTADPLSLQLSFVFPGVMEAYQGSAGKLFVPRCLEDTSSSPNNDCIEEADVDVSDEVLFLRYKQFVEAAIHRETPAHITPIIHWLDVNDLARFEYLYQLWIKEKIGAENDDGSLKRAVGIGRVMARLLGFDPEQNDEIVDLSLRLPAPVTLPNCKQWWESAYQDPCDDTRIPTPSAIYSFESLEGSLAFPNVAGTSVGSLLPGPYEDDALSGSTIGSSSTSSSSSISSSSSSGLSSLGGACADWFDGGFAHICTAVGLAQTEYEQQSPYTLHPMRGVELSCPNSNLVHEDANAFSLSPAQSLAVLLVFRAWGTADQERLLVSKNAEHSDTIGYSLSINSEGCLSLKLHNYETDSTVENVAECATSGVVNDGAWHAVLAVLEGRKETTVAHCEESVEYFVTGKLFTDVGDAVFVSQVDGRNYPYQTFSAFHLGANDYADHRANAANSQIAYLALWEFDDSPSTLLNYNSVLNGTALDKFWTANRPPALGYYPANELEHKHTGTIALPTALSVAEDDSYLLVNDLRQDLVAKYHGGFDPGSCQYPAHPRHLSQFPCLASRQNEIADEESSSSSSSSSSIDELIPRYVYKLSSSLRSSSTPGIEASGYAVNGPTIRNYINKSEEIIPEFLSIEYKDLPPVDETGVWYASSDEMLVAGNAYIHDDSCENPVAYRAPDGTSSATLFYSDPLLTNYSFFVCQNVEIGEAEFFSASVWVKVLSADTKVELGVINQGYYWDFVASASYVSDQVSPYEWTRLAITCPMDTITDETDPIPGISIRIQRDFVDGDPELGEVRVLLWGAQVEAAQHVGPYVPSVQEAAICDYEVPLRYVLSDYFVGSDGRASFKVRFPFSAERKDKETLCTLTGFSSDNSAKVKIEAFVRTVELKEAPSSSSSSLFLSSSSSSLFDDPPHELVLTAMRQEPGASSPSSAEWSVMGECAIPCDLYGHEETEVELAWDFTPRTVVEMLHDFACLGLNVNGEESSLYFKDLKDKALVCDFVAEHLHISGQRCDEDFPADELPSALLYDIVVYRDSKLNLPLHE